MTVAIAANNLSLVVITHKGCPVCESWHKEVSPYYSFEASKKSLPPMKEYDISDNGNRSWVYKNIGPITGLPTFVLLEGDKVKQKFDGYRDYQDFFINLNEVLIKVIKEQELAQF